MVRELHVASCELTNKREEKREEPDGEAGCHIGEGLCSIDEAIIHEHLQGG